MTSPPTNPFDRETDPDRHAIWRQLIVADTEAFVARDWSRIADDFDAEHFEGLRAALSTNPEHWQIACPTLDAYRDGWLRAAAEFARKRFVNLTLLQAVYARCRLDTITIAGDRAIAVKKFSGTVEVENAPPLTDRRQTLYRLHRASAHWKVVGFIGFLPYPSIGAD